jgi:hypothetical protein
MHHLNIKIRAESLALILDTSEGQYVLHRQGGNPFNDPELQKLDGKTTRCTGFITGYVLKISDWTSRGGAIRANCRLII